MLCAGILRDSQDILTKSLKNFYPNQRWTFATEWKQKFCYWLDNICILHLVLSQNASAVYKNHINTQNSSFLGYTGWFMRRTYAQGWWREPWSHAVHKFQPWKQPGWIQRSPAHQNIEKLIVLEAKANDKVLSCSVTYEASWEVYTSLVVPGCSTILGGRLSSRASFIEQALPTSSRIQEVIDSLVEGWE